MLDGYNAVAVARHCLDLGAKENAQAPLFVKRDEELALLRAVFEDPRFRKLADTILEERRK